MTSLIRVEIKIESRKLILGFRTSSEAESYCRRIQPRTIHQELSLESRQSSEDPTEVQLRLPSAITEIVASTSLPSFAGFYFRFRDSDTASRWRKSLVIFESPRGRTRDLYIVRDMGTDKILLADAAKAPAPAIRSKPPRY
ncbi:hypothetical protein TruAng_010829 [Truncatella angustata]|nr:hypothetical protein TruAng_010829 [Truncatella angustata]